MTSPSIYYSDAAKALSSDVVEISFSQPTNFGVEINYGDGTGDPVAVLTGLTSTRTITITNSSVVPNLLLEYNNSGTWTSLSENPSFSIDVESSSVGVYSCVVTVSSDIDLSVWGNKTFRVELSSFSDGDKMILINASDQSFGFETNFEPLPNPVFTTQPQNDIFESNAEFTASYKHYNTSLVSSGWQYSDDYDESNPGSANWVDVSSEDVDMSSTIMSTFGDLSYLNYGNIGSAPNLTVASSTLTVLSFNSSRYYRFKFVVV